MLHGIFTQFIIHVLFSLQVRSLSISVNVPTSAPANANVVKDNFAAISMELNILNTLIGNTPQTIPNAMVAYLKNIKSRITQPLRLRVGGNSLDGSIFNPDATQMITFNLASTANGIENVPVTYGPQVVTTLKQLGSDVGGISHLLGLSLIRPNNDSDVVRFASFAEKTLSGDLDAFLLGNEPDLYFKNGKRSANYTLSDYLSEVGKVVSDLHDSSSGNLVSKSILGGPSTCCGWVLSNTIKAGYISQHKDELKYITIQHYPEESCSTLGIERWNLTYLANHANVINLSQWNLDGVSLAKADGKEVLMDEYNSASCGGAPGRSNTFAAAMWSVDYTLSLAIRNYSASYIHTREQNISYNIFDPPTSSVSSWTTGPQYYSLLLLAEALRGTNPSTGLSVVEDLRLTDSSGSSVAGYVIYDGTGKNPQRLVLLNYGDASFGSTPNVSFTIPAGLSPQGKDGAFSVKLLSAPSLSEETSIQWAGQNVDGSGNLQGTVVENEIQCQSGCSIDVPGPAVALVGLTTSGALGKNGSGSTSASIVAVCLILFTLCFGHVAM